MEQGDVEIPVKDSKESKGGLKYEVVLALPSVPTPPRRSISPNAVKLPLCVEDIEEKLNAARIRKKSLEDISVSQLNEKFMKLQEIHRKKRLSEQISSESAMTNLTVKMETKKENREAHLNQIVEKARIKNQRVEEVRKASEKQIQELMLSIQKKIEGANEAREAQIATLLQKLQDHDEHHAKVRKTQKEESVLLLEKHQSKLEKAEVNRNSILKALQEKQIEHLRHLEDVRRKKEMNSSNNECTEKENGCSETKGELIEPMVNLNLDKQNGNSPAGEQPIDLRINTMAQIDN